MNVDCQPYTLLFDLKRESFDGRSFDQYLKWLTATINLVPGLIVFHDGCLRSFHHPNATLLEIVKEDLITFSKIEEVKKVLASFTPKAEEDITFFMPSYSLTQFAKIELGAWLNKRNIAKSYLWMDAGISRFITKFEDINLQSNSKRLLEHNCKFVFEIEIRRNIAFKSIRLPSPEIGTCKRIFSGASFWINAHFMSQLWQDTQILIQDWISQGVWDNEQVGLFHIFQGNPLIKQTRFLIQTENAPGRVAIDLTSKNFSISSNSDRFVKFLLRR